MTNLPDPNNQIMPPLRGCDHIKGSPSTTVTLIEYGDYQSSRAGQAYFTVKDLQNRLGDQLCFVYRHFPQTPPRSPAWKAAEVAEAAFAQGKFWEMHDILYQHSQDLDDSNLVDYATQVNLDVQRLLREMADHLYSERVQDDVDTGISDGVEDVPTFVINIRHQGTQNLDVLLNKILEATNHLP